MPGASQHRVPNGWCPFGVALNRPKGAHENPEGLEVKDERFKANCSLRLTLPATSVEADCKVKTTFLLGQALVHFHECS